MHPLGVMKVYICLFVGTAPVTSCCSYSSESKWRPNFIWGMPQKQHCPKLTHFTSVCCLLPGTVTERAPPHCSFISRHKVTLQNLHTLCSSLVKWASNLHPNCSSRWSGWVVEHDSLTSHVPVKKKIQSKNIFCNHVKQAINYYLRLFPQ